MNEKIELKLTAEDIAAGVELVKDPSSITFLPPVNVTDKNIEKMARGFIMGTQSIQRRKEVREQLQDKVVKRIGKKGKYLTDKLFELIEGVYVIEGNADGRNSRGIRYYKVPPNLQAIIYALDRVLGKPTIHVEKDEEKKGIKIVESIIKNLAGDTVKQERSIEIKE
jgi:hypothetical protein